MLNEIITASHVLPPGVEVSFGTLTEPHEFAQINVTGDATDKHAAGTLWRLYSITPAGEALISETELQDPRLVSRRIASHVTDGALIELRAFNPGAIATLAIDASLVGYDPGCCTPPDPPAAAAFQTDDFTPTNGQTVFALSETPSAPENLRLTVNGALYLQTTDYTVIGTVLTWLNTSFALTTVDWVEAFYQYEA